jgi:hypothetical protein
MVVNRYKPLNLGAAANIILSIAVNYLVDVSDDEGCDSGWRFGGGFSP